MAEQTLNVRRQRLEGHRPFYARHASVAREIKEKRKLEALESLEGLEARRRAMAKHGGSQITSRYTRARIHTTGVLCFLLSQVSHKLYNPLCNNHLNRFQKQHSTLSHFHAATPPPKIPKTPSSKQLFVLQSKTTRHFPQNNTLFSVKRHVVFYKTICCFW